MSEEAIHTETKDKKARNKKKDKERRKSEEKAAIKTNEIDDEPVKATKKDKEDDKKDRKRHRGDGDDDDNDDESDVDDSNKGEDVTPGKSKKKDRAARKKEQAFLLAKVPKVNEDGIIYTKLQIRRMTKRVKRGLAPVPTAKEENDRLRRDAELRREDDALYTNEDEQDDDDDDDEEDEAENGGAMDEDNDKEKIDKVDASDDDKDEANDDPKKSVTNPSPNKKAKRNKAVPEDYVCSACKNKHTPVHWIYDCPEKITKKGTNLKKKKLRGLNEPDAKKVFISGLPFDAKTKDVESLFSPCGTIAFCKLIKFEDTGRCKGQAYISFDTEAAAKKALKLSGTTIDNIVAEDSSKKSKKDELPKRKDLKLKVSKVMNRRFTHKRS